MIKYKVKFKKKDIRVSLAVTDPNQFEDLLFEGEEDVVADFREWLAYEHGAFGHLIGYTTSAIDLDAALQLQKEYKFELLEGAELVQVYDPGIPEGART